VPFILLEFQAAHRGSVFSSREPPQDSIPDANFAILTIVELVLDETKSENST